LILVGLMMMTIVQDIPWTSYEEAIPAFVTLLLMPFTYSITTGIGAGFIASTLLKIASGRVRELHPLMLLAAAAFVVISAFRWFSRRGEQKNLPMSASISPI